MKRLFNYSHLWLLVLALLAVSFLACDSGEEEPGGGQDPTELPELADLVGRWGITQTQSGGNTETRIPCENTIEVESSGNFLFVDAARGRWLEGTIALNANDSTITLTFDGQTEMLKLLSVSDTGFELQFRDEDNGTVTLSNQQFTLLESADCPGFTNAMITNKFSISEFTQEIYQLNGEGDEIGSLVGSQTVDNIEENAFSVEFKSDGSVLNIDHINEYGYQLGSFRNLDGHNMILTFERGDGEEDHDELVHLKVVNGNVLTFQTVDYDEQQSSAGVVANRLISTFTMAPNSANAPSISGDALLGKWSANVVSEKGYENGQVAANETFDNIPHNKMTFEFKADGTFQFIDLLDEIAVRRGEYERLDGSNILLFLDEDNGGDAAGGGGEDGEAEPLLFLLKLNENNGRIQLISFEASDEGEGDGTQGDNFELETFEITLNKNTGDEPGITGDELLGNWQVVEVEVLGEQGQGGDNEGPQVGMVLQFEGQGMANVTFEGQQVTTFEYELLDPSNIFVVFDDEGDGSGSNEEPEANIFHVTVHNGSLLEMTLYAPGDDGDNNSGQQGSPGGAEYHLVFQRL